MTLPGSNAAATSADAVLSGHTWQRAQPQQRGQGNERAQRAQPQQRGPGNERARRAQPQQRGPGNERAQRAQPQQRGPGNERAQRAQPQQRGPGNERAQRAQPQQRGQGSERAQPQQRGQGNERAQPQRGPRPDVRGNGAAGTAGRAGRPGRPSPAELDRRVESLPGDVRGWVRSPRSHERLVAGAALLGSHRGLEPGRLTWHHDVDHVLVTNRGGDVLLRLDERRARDLGFWELRRLGDRRPRGNAPAFCRSGAGHPVWGREWCLDRGFGLGSRPGTIWSRTGVDDVIFRRTADRDRLTRDVLIGVLGDVVVNRIALHALSLGFDEPVYGRWADSREPAAPRILYLHSGDVVVAEFVDLDRDDRADVLYVLQPQ